MEFYKFYIFNINQITFVKRFGLKQKCPILIKKSKINECEQKMEKHILYIQFKQYDKYYIKSKK